MSDLTKDFVRNYLGYAFSNWNARETVKKRTIEEFVDTLESMLEVDRLTKECKKLIKEKQGVK